MPPKVSIVVPVYNLETYISRCLNSILAQTYTDFEVICINDGSSDKSGDIISKHAQRDGRIVLVNKENEGLPAARKTGLTCCRGEFVVHVDGDDYIEPQALQELLHAQGIHDADIVFSDYYIDDEDSGTRNPHRDYFFQKVHTEDLISSLLEKETFFIWGKLIRRSLYQDITLPPEIKYTEDMVHLIQIASKCRRASNVNIPLYHYIKRQGSMTHTIGKESLLQWYAATQFLVHHCQALPYADKLVGGILKLQANQADIYLSYIKNTGFYRNDLRKIVLSILSQWKNGGQNAIRQLPGSSKVRLLLCLFSQHLAVGFGKAYNKLVHHV